MNDSVIQTGREVARPVCNDGIVEQGLGKTAVTLTGDEYNRKEIMPCQVMGLVATWGRF